eukprot:COSAG04_NODE_3153_length_3112_cov_1.489877_1_plen_28_part_10
MPEGGQGEAAYGIPTPAARAPPHPNPVG